MPYFQKSDYPELPEDTPLLCEITEVMMTKSRFGDEVRDQVELHFEVVEGGFTGAKIRSWANAVFSPRSNLAKIAAAAFADDELEGIDTDQLVGRQLYVLGDYGEDGKSSFLRPRKFKPAVRAESNGHVRRPSVASPTPTTRAPAPPTEEPEPADRHAAVAVSDDPPPDYGIDV
ncbi:MAG: hypothetical protein ACREQM_09200 [Candidatus Dormibacteraceae bacterium]